MEALLIEQWLGGDLGIEILDEASLTLARNVVRNVDAPTDVVDRGLLVVSELGRNQLRHARRGHIGCRRIERGDRLGIEIIAADAGKGINGIEAALEARGREAGSLGVGLGSVKRLSTELDIDIRVGEGTCVRARIFETDVLRRREVGIYGRPIPGEDRNGDHAAFRRVGETLRVMVCDGLGHGRDARTAADRAVDVFGKHPSEAPANLIEVAHRELASTRGVVMAAASIEADALELASAGNVEAYAVSFRQTRRFGGTPATVGGRSGAIRVRSERSPLADEVFMLTTDGIVTKASIENEGGLLLAHPVVIAQTVLERFARSNDDALVLVVR